MYVAESFRALSAAVPALRIQRFPPNGSAERLPGGPTSQVKPQRRLAFPLLQSICFLPSPSCVLQVLPHLPQYSCGVFLSVITYVRKRLPRCWAEGTATMYSHIFSSGDPPEKQNERRTVYSSPCSCREYQVALIGQASRLGGWAAIFTICKPRNVEL